MMMIKEVTLTVVWKARIKVKSGLDKSEIHKEEEIQTQTHIPVESTPEVQKAPGKDREELGRRICCRGEAHYQN